MQTRDAISLALVLGVGYALYKWVGPGSPVAKAAGEAADAVAGAIANPIAKLSNWAYGSVSTIPTGNVILPNGTKVPISKVQNMRWDSAVGVASFVYNGYGYIIPPNPSGGAAYDQNGDYHAQ
jgi:hypothetical protein